MVKFYPMQILYPVKKTKDIDEVRQKGFLQYSTYQQNIIAIKATSLFKGYYPHYEEKEIYLTDDVGYFDQEGFLCILGRNSQKKLLREEKMFFPKK